MISQLGAPSWFIMLLPADSCHPTCLYYADKNIEFKPNLRLSNEQNLLVAQNPIAAAHFFDLMIHMYIRHLLGIGVKHSGLLLSSGSRMTDSGLQKLIPKGLGLSLYAVPL
jgi:hypothetical protein